MPSENSFLVDMHVHATQSRKHPFGTMIADSFMNVENIAARAGSFGLHTLGIMEHVEPLSGRHPWSEALHVKQLVDKIKSKFDFKILSGCEASITDLQGNLSAAADELKSAGLDYVIASVHSLPSRPASIDEYHSLVIEMMKNVVKFNPYIDIIGHPWRDTPKILKWLGINEPWSFNLIPEKDITELAKLAANAGIALEISRPSFEMHGYFRFLNVAAMAGGIFTIGSDAHQWDRFRPVSAEETALLKANGISSNNLKAW